MVGWKVVVGEKVALGGVDGPLGLVGVGAVTVGAIEVKTELVGFVDGIDTVLNEGLKVVGSCTGAATGIGAVVVGLVVAFTGLGGPEIEMDEGLGAAGSCIGIATSVGAVVVGLAVPGVEGAETEMDEGLGAKGLVGVFGDRTPNMNS